MRKILKIAAFISYSLITSLLLLEVCLRLWGNIPLLTTDNFIILQLDLVKQNTGVNAHDPLLGWTLKDNLYNKGGGMTTGAYGLRMNDNDIRPPSLGAILAVGDSFTAGSGVRDSESWPAQLERLVERPVHNAASGGWGVDQIILRAEQLIPVLLPQVLIVSILGQDSLRNNFDLYGGGYKPYFVIENDKAILKGVPVPKVLARPMEIGLIRKIVGHSFAVHWTMTRLAPTSWIDNSYRYRQIHANEVGVEISCKLMDRLVSLQREYKLRVIVAMQYGAAESSANEPPWYGPPVLECAKERGFQALDTYPPQKMVADTDPERFKELWLDEGGQLGHMSVAGNRLIAELFQEILLAK